MPITSSATKALRRDRRRGGINTMVRSRMYQSVKRAVSEPTPQFLSQAYSAIDRAAKKGIIHINRASRLKSRLSKAVSKGQGF